MFKADELLNMQIVSNTTMSPVSVQLAQLPTISNTYIYILVAKNTILLEMLHLYSF